MHADEPYLRPRRPSLAWEGALRRVELDAALHGPDEISMEPASHAANDFATVIAPVDTGAVIRRLTARIPELDAIVTGVGTDGDGDLATVRLQCFRTGSEVLLPAFGLDITLAKPTLDEESPVVTLIRYTAPCCASTHTAFAA